MNPPSRSPSLPAGMKHALIGRFLKTLLPESVDTSAIADMDAEAPFLTVVTRTQGLRPDTLRDVFLCLSGQSCTDFEHLVMGHRLTPEADQAVQELIDENPEWLRQRIRFLRVDRGNRTAPLNAAFSAARGAYVAVLDDDDLVLGHWVEAFKTLAASNAGSILRSRTVYQQFDEANTVFAKSSPRASAEIIDLYPAQFDLFTHLQENRTPLMALAFPRAAYVELGIAFDESLSTCEDWDYLVRAAAVCGVASSSEVTGIYRHWNGRTSSRTDHSANEWLSNQHYVMEKHNNLNMLMAAGSAARLRQILNERDRLARAVRFFDSSKTNLPYTDEIVEAVQTSRRVLDADNPERLEELRVQLTALYDSIWWKISAPVRWASAMTGRGHFHQPEPHSLTAAHLRMAINNVIDSTSWKVSEPVRSLFYRLQGRRHPQTK